MKNFDCLIIDDEEVPAQYNFAPGPKSPYSLYQARTGNDDMLLALNIGGDDYIPKPYSLSVLLAKVKALLKRYAASSLSGPNVNPRLLIDGQTERILLHGQHNRFSVYHSVCLWRGNAGVVENT